MSRPRPAGRRRVAAPRPARGRARLGPSACCGATGPTWALAQRAAGERAGLVSSARLAAADLDGDALDELIGVSCGDATAPAHLLVGRLVENGGAPALDLSARPIAGDLLGLQGIEMADLDRDGRLDLAASFTGDAGGAGAGVAILWNRGGELDAGAPSVAAVPGTGRVGALASLNADVDPQLEIAVDSDAGVLLADLDAAGDLHFAADPLAETGRPRAADLDGDGLDDLVVLASHVCVALPDDAAPAVR